MRIKDKHFRKLTDKFVRCKQLGDITFYGGVAAAGLLGVCIGVNRIVGTKYDIMCANFEKMIREHALSDEELQILSDILDRS